MFTTTQKREIAEAIQKLLRDTKDPKLPDGEIRFSLCVMGSDPSVYGNITNNGCVQNA